MRKSNFRSKSKEDTGNTEQDKEDNTGPVNSCVSGMPLTPAGPQEMATENQEENHYGNIQRPHTNQAAKTRNQEKSTTIHNPYPQSEDDIQYTSIQFPRSSAAPRSAVQAAEDDSVLYSTVNKYPPKSTSVSVSPSGEIVEGGSVTLTCSSNANPPVHKYTWFKNSTAITSWIGSWQSYTIKDIKPSDSGEYSCKALNEVGSGSSHSKHLNVQYAPKSTTVSVSPSGEIVEGGSVTLTCSSNANPPVQRYTWFKKNDTGVWQTGSGQSLNTYNFRSWNSGQYYCEAENKHGVHNSTALSITTKGEKSLMVAICASAGITALVTLVLVAVTVWMCKRRKGGTPRARERGADTQACPNPDNDTYTALNLNDVSSDYNTLTACPNPDNDTYTALNRNDVSSDYDTLTSLRNAPASVFTDLQVEVNPATVTEGQRVTLTCRTTCTLSGSPAFIWYKNKLPLSTTNLYNNYLQFTASNPPKSTSVSVSPSGEIVEGGSVTLTCSSNANPPVQRYTWFKNSRAITSWRGSEQSYTIKDIKPSDSGEYYCEAVNGVGRGWSPHIPIKVQYPPKSTSVSVSPSGEIVEGGSVTLTCSSNANPPVQRYTWFKNSRAITSWRGSEQSYTIKDIKPSDSGEYYYAPKSTSVSVSSSGERVEGDSVTLTCSSNANPPVHRYTWFKKNDTGVWQTGSGHSLNFSNFRSWNSGQYYCEAENKHGVHNSTALSITTKAVLLWMRKSNFRSKSKEDTGNTEQDKEDNTGPVNSCVSGMPLTPAGPQEMATENQEENHYGNIQRPHTNQAAKTRNQEKSTTVHNPYPQSEDDIQYASIQFPCSSAAPRSAVQAAEDDSVLYSTVNKCKT
ncbi:hypothetical protein AAFF_G00372000 [Aldrovandia affinis]|uniref:Ig-like domain-containing protein n=1 Tax=Aldrovandia affinis TaxID=143900 RepID=A0AAD7VZJ8_9TELE|nr:hypothetical protein AAFF_G00372000 [Aldrovandia affinis]